MNEKDMAFLIIKHEAVQRGLIGEILGRIEKKGLKVIALKMFEMKKEQVMDLYDNCKKLPFFEELLTYNSDCPVIGLVVAGPNANKGANEVCGVIGRAGTVRGDYALCHSRNVLHCSDEGKTQREIDLFFSNRELFFYDTAWEDWIR